MQEQELLLLNSGSLFSRLETLLEQAEAKDLDYIGANLEHLPTLTRLVTIWKNNPANAKAYYVLSNLKKSAAQDYLATLLTQNEDERLLSLCKAANYAPTLPHKRALFYIATDQWAKYEALDPDRKLFHKEFARLEGPYREKVLNLLKAAGRTDLLFSLPTRRSLVPATNELSYSLLLGYLQENRYAELWEVAKTAAPCWAIWILGKLQKAGWQPESPEEAANFAELQTKAAACPPDLVEQALRKLSYRQQDVRNHDFTQPCLPTAAVSQVREYALSPNGRWVARLSGQSYQPKYQVTVYDCNNPTELQSFEIIPLTSPSIVSGYPVLAIPNNPYDEQTICEVVEAVFSTDNRNLIVLGRWQHRYEREAHWGLWLFPLLQDRPVCRFLLNSAFRPPRIVIKANSSWVAVCCESYIGLYSYDGLFLTPTAELTNLDWKVRDVAFTPSGIDLAVGSEGGKIRFLLLPNLEIVQEYSTNARSCQSLTFSRDGQLLIFGPELQAISLAYNSEVVQAEQLPVTHLTFSPNQTFLAVAHPNGQFSLRHGNDSYYLSALGKIGSTITALEFSPDERELLLLGQNGILYRADLRLLRLYSTKLVPKGFEDLEQLAVGTLQPDQARMCDFINTQMVLPWRYEIEIEVEANMTATAHDIEIET